MQGADSVRPNFNFAFDQNKYDFIKSAVHTRDRLIFIVLSSQVLDAVVFVMCAICRLAISTPGYTASISFQKPALPASPQFSASLYSADLKQMGPSTVKGLGFCSWLMEFSLAAGFNSTRLFSKLNKCGGSISRLIWRQRFSANQWPAVSFSTRTSLLGTLAK